MSEGMPFAFNIFAIIGKYLFARLIVNKVFPWVYIIDVSSLSKRSYMSILSRSIFLPAKSTDLGMMGFTTVEYSIFSVARTGCTAPAFMDTDNKAAITAISYL
jgi:hypothetical protein